jgi:hypothetical protein
MAQRRTYLNMMRRIKKYQNRFNICNSAMGRKIMYRSQLGLQRSSKGLNTCRSLSLLL